ncbi:MAG: accessory Sec system protein Asp3 [Lachnospiraceae bacterium]|nr:accessory Sec system protein Asp3 [Lachnospiraceae bacterium]
MSEHVLHTIFWENAGLGAYLYGSDLRLNRDKSVQFENLMMPSGKAINTWRSAANFLMDRCEPQLPLLFGGREYIIRTFLTDDPPGTVLMRLDFFNQQKEKIGTRMFDQKEGEFTFPAEAYSYQAGLVQGGSDRLHFYMFELFSKEDRLFREVMCPTEDGKTLNLFLPKMAGHALTIFDEDIPDGVTDYMVLSPYLSIASAEFFQSVLGQILPEKTYEEIRIHWQDEEALRQAEKRAEPAGNLRFVRWEKEINE